MHIDTIQSSQSFLYRKDSQIKLHLTRPKALQCLYTAGGIVVVSLQHCVGCTDLFFFTWEMLTYPGWFLSALFP